MERTMCYSAQRFLALIMLWLVVGVIPATAAALSADEIINKAYRVDGGHDGISRLTFTFQKPDTPEKKLTFSMVWKEYGGEGDINSKILFFSEFPPDERGKSFMAWIYKDRMDDHWVYLPELRMVRKVSHGAHMSKHDDDDFALSVLTRGDLVPRKPDEDRHSLLGEEELKGKAYYVVESTPKQASDGYPYQKVRRWISKEEFLVERIDYYGSGTAPEKQQEIKWERRDKAWVWTRVLGVQAKSGARTLLEISDIRVNLGLKDEVFSARSLRLGIESVQ